MPNGPECSIELLLLHKPCEAMWEAADVALPLAVEAETYFDDVFETSNAEINSFAVASAYIAYVSGIQGADTVGPHSELWVDHFKLFQCREDPFAVVPASNVATTTVMSVLVRGECLKLEVKCSGQ